MKDRPILFSAPMVRALLDGSKTQTRRVVKPQFAADAEPAEMGATNDQGHQISGHSGVWWDDCAGNPDEAIRCPHNKPGDRLWVRETFAEGVHQMCDANHWVYAADPFGDQGRLGDKWRPSIFMPRTASRITLEITGVRVERLQDISEADAEAEGIKENVHPMICRVSDYADLWESINGGGSWELNPWVWVIEFKKVTP